MPEISEAAKEWATKYRNYTYNCMCDKIQEFSKYTLTEIIQKAIDEATAAKDAEIEKLQRELNYAAQWAADRLNHGFASSQDKER